LGGLFLFKIHDIISYRKKEGKNMLVVLGIYLLVVFLGVVSYLTIKIGLIGIEKVYKKVRKTLDK